MKMLSKYKFSLTSLAAIVAVATIVGPASIWTGFVYAGAIGLLLVGVVALCGALFVLFELGRFILEKVWLN